jgi:hypothetical protein
MQFLKKTLGYYFRMSPAITPPAGEPDSAHLHPHGCQEHDSNETSPAHHSKEENMISPLTSNPASNEDDADAKLESYISQFVTNWRESQQVTLNQAAIKKADRRWKAKQERERQEVSDMRPDEG